MRKRIASAAALVVALSATAAYAGAFDGDYSFKKGRNVGDLTVKEDGGGKYHFTFSNTWIDGANAHTGELDFSVAVDAKGNATYQDDGCGLKLKLASRKIKVVQDFQKGSCDAGANVEFDGLYKKAKSK